MTTQHTPTPYRAERSNIIAATNANAHVNAPYLARAESMSDAAFIVTACNAHDELVAALREIEIRARAGIVNPHEDLGGIARAALAKVTP